MIVIIIYLLIAPTYGGMARLSWPGWLVDSVTLYAVNRREKEDQRRSGVFLPPTHCRDPVMAEKRQLMHHKGQIHLRIIYSRRWGDKG